MPIDQSSSEQEALGSEAETAGSLLAAARKARGLDEKQVADHLHITVHYVKAIEADLYEKLPGAIFARGYIKSYANYLGLDTEDIVSRYQALAGQQPAGPTQIKAPVTNKPRRQRNLQWALASVGVFSVVIIAAWLLSGDPEPNEAAAVNTESRLPDSSRPASPATAAESVTAGSQDVALAPSAADNSAVEEPATGQALLSSTEIGVAEAEQSVGQETVQTEAAASALAVAETETVPDTSPDTSPDISPDISPDSARADSSQGDAQAAGLAVSDTVPATPNNETAEDSVPTTVSADSTVTASTAEPVISAASTVDTANSDNVEPAQQTAAAADVQQAAVDRSAAPRPEELAVINVLEGSDGERIIAVDANGEDVLRISFSGESWVEVNDSLARLVYRDLRQAGDVLEITGHAPFNILLGDAPLASLRFNGDEIDVSDDIRIDNSARLTVGL